MKFIPKQSNCSCCKKPLKADQMEYIGYQVTDAEGNGFPLFNCPCGSTISGIDPALEKKTKVFVTNDDKLNN